MSDTFVFELQNLYIPENEEYESEKFPIRIEPLSGAEEFERERRDEGSKYQTGYWATAKCYIEADEDRAKELAQWVAFVYSFFQVRDVRWDTYYPEGAPDDVEEEEMYQSPIDNTGLRLIQSYQEDKLRWSENIGPVVDEALGTIDEADDRLAADLRSNIRLFLHAEATQLITPKFLMYWLVVEANADRNYHRYMKSQREYLFDDDEKDRVREYVLEEFSDEFSDGQLERLDYNLNHDYIYEPSTLVKIKKYTEQIGLGFDDDEVEEIVEESREIRNDIVHSMDDTGLKDNLDVLVGLRKLGLFMVMRELGVEPQLQEKLATPRIFGPDSDHEWSS